MGKLVLASFFAVAFVAAVCLMQFEAINMYGLRETHESQSKIDRQHTSAVVSTKPKLADDCYHVFLDVGSNIGNHVRFLYEPQLYPKATVARDFFEKTFGPQESRANGDVCVFSFEPNPDHYGRHEHLAKAYGSQGWRYTPIHAGVSHRAGGNITFYHTGDDLGFTTKKSNCRRECRPEHVPIIRLADWIQQEVAGRRIPQPIGDDTIQPRVVMKMDVEFMEYEIIPDLMLSGVLCGTIHSMMGEFHHDVGMIAYLWPMTYKRNTSESSGNNDVWLLERKKAREISIEWLRMMDHNPNCDTIFSMKDDESYRNDGMDLPTILSQSNSSIA